MNIPNVGNRHFPDGASCQLPLSIFEKKLTLPVQKSRRKCRGANVPGAKDAEPIKRDDDAELRMRS
jgi:hypothetical protein